MKFCQPHWDRLRSVVNDKGMGSLVARSGEEAAEMLKAQLQPNPIPAASFDPLMSCHNMIASNALSAGGLYLLTGDYCPLCELNAHSKQGMDEQWIESATEAALGYCREHNLLPRVQ